MKTYLSKSGQQLINEIREACGESDEWIAGQVEVEQSTISRIRRGDVKDTASEIWKRLVIVHRRVVRKKASQ